MILTPLEHFTRSDYTTNKKTIALLKDTKKIQAYRHAKKQKSSTNSDKKWLLSA
jgi:hypothetical protein